MKTPQNLAELKTFLGMITYLGKFLPNLSQETECLRQLEKKEVPWHWIEQHDAAVKRIKRLVCSSPVLKYFDPKEHLTIECDASQNGLGAVLLQDEKPVAYASRALTDCE